MKWIREVLTVREVGMLITACRRSFAGRRDRALIYTQYRCVLRISEALALTPKDYKEDNCILYVRNGKGGKSRVVHVPEDARRVLRDWLTYRGDISDRKPIFCTPAGNALHKCNVNKTYKRLAEKAGIDKRVHTHQLRYSGASNMFRSGVRLDLIQGQLGHTKVTTTGIYLLELDPTERINELENAKW